MATEVHTRGHCLEAGSADQPLLVLLHGSVVTRAIWRPQLEVLGETLHVLAPDLPGHGTRASVAFAFDTAVAEVAALIRAHGGRAVVCGLSLGGYVAMRLAARHPALVPGLVVCGATTNFTGARGTYLKGVAWLMQHGWLMPSAARLEARTRALFPPALATAADAQVREGLYPAALPRAFAEMAGIDFIADLAAYPGPVLVMNGEHDRPARRGEQAFVAAAVRAQLRIVAGARHACSLDAPETVSEALRAFVGQVTPPTILR